MISHIFVVLVTVAATVWSVESLAAPQLGCKYGSQGNCKTPPARECPSNTFCRNGECCRRLPPNPRCKDGQNGECGGLQGLICPTGTTCQFKPDGIADGKGKCCLPDKPQCQWGKLGFCGGVAGDVCPQGTNCKFLDKKVTDGQGACCIIPRCDGQKGACTKNDQCPEGTVCLVLPDAAGGKGKCCDVSGGGGSEMRK